MITIEGNKLPIHIWAQPERPGQANGTAGSASSGEGMSIIDPSFHCCFCDELLPEQVICSVTLGWPDDTYQTWWCHRDCFEKQLRPLYRIMRDEIEQQLLD